jgi:hypothetical protein
MGAGVANNMGHAVVVAWPGSSERRRHHRQAAVPIDTYRVVLMRSLEAIWSGHFVCASDDVAIDEARKLLESCAARGDPGLCVKISRRGRGSSAWLGVWTWDCDAIWRAYC